MIKVTLKDGSNMEVEEGISIYEVAKKISERLAKAATSALLNGEVVDLRTALNEDCSLSILTFEDEEGKGAYRHTTSHIMAQAVKKLFPNAKLAIGPSIENGFYYDYDVEKPFSPEDLEAIEKEMDKICKEDLSIELAKNEMGTEIRRTGADDGDAARTFERPNGLSGDEVFWRRGEPGDSVYERI